VCAGGFFAWATQAFRRARTGLNDGKWQIANGKITEFTLFTDFLPPRHGDTEGEMDEGEVAKIAG
jgi:hypothetical protein